MVFLAGPGAFFPVEQEVGRAVASRVSSGQGLGPLLRRAAIGITGLTTILALLAAALSQPLLDHVFDDQALVLIGFGASLFGYATLHLARGALSGAGRFRAYACLLAAEGILRLAAAAILLAVGVETAGPLAMVVGLTPLAAVAFTMHRQRGLMTNGPPAPWGELCRAIGFLLLASLLTQVLIHAGPLAVKLLEGEHSRELTARFFAGVLLARIPLFLFLAVQAALLPRLASYAEQHDRRGFCRALSRLLAVVAILGSASVIAAFFLGQQAVETLFGAAFVLDDRGLALLAASTAVIMLAQSLGQAVVALQGQAASAVSWLVGVIVFGAALAIGEDVLLRVELGLLTGSAAAAAGMALALGTRLERVLPEKRHGADVAVES
ncbi:MAG TPA: hypothetical protein VNA57_13370 [Acidimicrobiales bacterium]|nr:hypothetical protein [Acidimicrobiales bacterium]